VPVWCPYSQQADRKSLNRRKLRGARGSLLMRAGTKQAELDGNRPKAVEPIPKLRVAGSTPVVRFRKARANAS
jgi:hypothetical protein